MLDLTCIQCGGPFQATRRDARYCSKPCRKRAWDLANVERKREHDAKSRARRKAKIAESGRRYRAANKERLTEARRAYYQRNKHRWPKRTAEQRRETDRAYRQRNREKIAAYLDAYYAANPARFIEYSSRRRALKRAAAGSATAVQIEARIDYFGGCCWVCSAPWEEVDHVKPLSKGGSNWPSNLRPICKRCNARKKARWYGVRRLADLAA